jgi:hypothetical protein
MGSNSTYKLQDITDDARRWTDCAPALSTGGSSDQPALSIATDVITAMVQGGPNGESMNWKWNRLFPTPFNTITYQQDYASNTINLAWIERAWMVDINSTMNPKRQVQIEVRRELGESYLPGSWQAKICWLPNNQLKYGQWGQTQIASQFGLVNPGPGVVYTNPVGVAGQTPVNPTTQVFDPATGTYWMLTTYGTCGNTVPSWSSNPTFPTVANPSATATTVNDGTCVWTAVNPNGMGFRVSPVPSQSSVVWQIYVIGQKFPVKFTSLGQSLDPLPDLYVSYFKAGFFAMCHSRNPDEKVRNKYLQEYSQWLKSLDLAAKAGQREPDDFGFYPERSIMDAGASFINFGAAWPYPGSPWGGF